MKLYEHLGLRQREIEFRFRETGIHYDPFYKMYRARVRYPDGYQMSRELQVYLDEVHQDELHGIAFFRTGGRVVFVSRFNIFLIQAFYEYLISQGVIEED